MARCDRLPLLALGLAALVWAAGAKDTFHFAVERLASLADPRGFGTAAACLGDANEPVVRSLAACLSGSPVVATADTRNPWVSLRSHLQHAAALAGVEAERLRRGEPEASVCAVLDHRCGRGVSSGLPVCLVTTAVPSNRSHAFGGSRCSALKRAVESAAGALSGKLSAAPPRGPGLGASTRAAVVLPARAAVAARLGNPSLSRAYALRVVQPAAQLATQLPWRVRGTPTPWVLAVSPVDTTPLYGLLRGSAPPSSAEAAAALHATAAAVRLSLPPGTLVVPVLVDWTDSQCPHVPPHAAPSRTLVLKSAAHISCFRPDSHLALPMPAAVVCAAAAAHAPRPLLLSFTVSPAARSRSPAARSCSPAARSRSPAARSRSPAAGSRSPAAPSIGPALALPPRQSRSEVAPPVPPPPLVAGLRVATRHGPAAL